MQVLASFTFGVRFNGEAIHHPGLAAPALLLLVGGVAGLAINGHLASDDEGTGMPLLMHIRLKYSVSSCSVLISLC